MKWRDKDRERELVSIAMLPIFPRFKENISSTSKPKLLKLLDKAVA